MQSHDELSSQAEIKDLARIMTIKYSSQLGDRQFDIAAKVDQAAAYATTTLQNGDRSFVYPVEGRMAHKEQNISPQEALFLLVDYIDHYFTEYFQTGENVYIPLDWSTYHYENLDLQLRGQVLNHRVEELAEQLLTGH